MINYPWIRQAAPFIDEEHVFYYNPSSIELLYSRIVHALRDKEKLKKMNDLAKAHIKSHYLHSAILKYILSQITSRSPKAEEKEM